MKLIGPRDLGVSKHAMDSLPRQIFKKYTHTSTKKKIEKKVDFSVIMEGVEVMKIGAGVNIFKPELIPTYHCLLFNLNVLSRTSPGFQDPVGFRVFWGQQLSRTVASEPCLGDRAKAGQLCAI